jgi:hypothetical protein
MFQSKALALIGLSLKRTIKPVQKPIRVVPPTPAPTKRAQAGDGVGEILIRDVVLPVVGKVSLDSARNVLSDMSV